MKNLLLLALIATFVLLGLMVSNVYMVSAATSDAQQQSLVSATANQFGIDSPQLTTQCRNQELTLIEGTIYLNDSAHTPVQNATVVVVCSHKTGKKTITNTTIITKSSSLKFDKGQYFVTFKDKICDEKDLVTVTATDPKTGGIGTNTGTVHDFIIKKLDVAMINVFIPIVPEFSLIAGLTTILAAVGIFFFVRKH